MMLAANFVLATKKKKKKNSKDKGEKMELNPK